MRDHDAVANVVKKEAFQYGANDYLVKLPDKIELIARLRSHAKHYMLQLERNAAFFALREMQKQLQKTNAELERLKSEYFNETNPTKKSEFRGQIEHLISSLTNNKNSFDFEIYF